MFHTPASWLCTMSYPTRANGINCKFKYHTIEKAANQITFVTRAFRQVFIQVTSGIFHGYTIITILYHATENTAAKHKHEQHTIPLRRLAVIPSSKEHFPVLNGYVLYPGRHGVNKDTPQTSTTGAFLSFVSCSLFGSDVVNSQPANISYKR